MLINEIIKGSFISQNVAASPFRNSQRPDSSHRILARIQVSEDEYSSMMPPPEQDVDYVFFRGAMYTISRNGYSFQRRVFPQYLSKNINKLPLIEDAAARTLTLHDPCKSVYTAVDPDGHHQSIYIGMGIILNLTFRIDF